MTTDILKFENLHKDYDMFCKKYKIKNNLIVRNKNEKKDENIDWNNLYTKEMKIIVDKIFYKDFENFNYSYSCFLKSKNII